MSEIIYVKDSPIPPDQTVILYYTSKRWPNSVQTCLASYHKEYTLECNDGDICEDLLDYHIEEDAWYFKEGWYEEVSHWDEYMYLALSKDEVYPLAYTDIPKLPKV